MCSRYQKDERGLQREKSSACIATRTKRKEETGFAKVKNGFDYRIQRKTINEITIIRMSWNLHAWKRSYSKNKEKEKKKQVNLSYDILQQLSKEGKVSAYDIAEREWIDAESPMVLERNEKIVTKIIKQMGL